MITVVLIGLGSPLALETALSFEGETYHAGGTVQTSPVPPHVFAWLVLRSAKAARAVFKWGYSQAPSVSHSTRVNLINASALATSRNVCSGRRGGKDGRDSLKRRDGLDRSTVYNSLDTRADNRLRGRARAADNELLIVNLKGWIYLPRWRNGP